MDTLGGMDPGRLGAQIRALSETAAASGGSARTELTELLGRHNPIDLARALPDLEQEEITLCFDLVDTETQGVVLAEAAPREQALLMLHVGDQGSQVIATMDPDDATDVLESVEPSDAEALLRELDGTALRLGGRVFDVVRARRGSQLVALRGSAPSKNGA